MSRPICQEDMYEYRVKQIFVDLRREYAEDESKLPFLDWVETRHKLVGRLFLTDVETYMGIPEEDE